MSAARPLMYLPYKCFAYLYTCPFGRAPVYTAIDFQEKHDAVEAVNKILNEAKTCLITVPTGYNQMLDEWLIHHKYDKEIRIIKRNCNNKWNEVIPDDFNGIRYTKYWANGLAVIEKSGEGT